MFQPKYPDCFPCYPSLPHPAPTQPGCPLTGSQGCRSYCTGSALRARNPVPQTSQQEIGLTVARPKAEPPGFMELAHPAAAPHLGRTTAHSAGSSRALGEGQREGNQRIRPRLASLPLLVRTLTPQLHLPPELRRGRSGSANMLLALGLCKWLSALLRRLVALQEAASWAGCLAMSSRAKPACSWGSP